MSRAFCRGGMVSLLLALLAGCASPDAGRDFVEDLASHPHTGRIIPNVPRLPVDRGNYGAQAVATLLAFWGKPIPTQQLKTQAAASEGGTELEERLMSVADAQGLWAYAWYGTWPALRMRLDAGVPVIVQIQHGTHAGSRRYAVVIGYDDKEDRVLCEEGGKEPTVYTYEEFTELWKPVRFWSLVICPPDFPQWELSAAELVTRARMYELRNESARALRDYSEAMAVQPLNSRICVNAANLYRKLGDSEKAEGLYRRAADINPRDGQALNNLAFLFAEEKRNLDEAYELAKRALLIEPTNPVALDTTGYILFLQERYDDAISYLEQAYQRSRPLTPARRRDIAVHLMRAYIAVGRTDKVGAMLSDLRFEDPQFAIPKDLKQWAPSGLESLP